jgi:hypothetical protein
MNSQGRPSVLAEVFGDVVRDTFGAHEDQNFCVLGANLVQVLGQFASFLKVAANFDNLRNIVVGGELHRTDVDLYHVFEKVLKAAGVSIVPKKRWSRKVTLASF